MAPSFIHNLIPRPKARAVDSRPFLEALRTVTWTQWAQFGSGFVEFLLAPSSRWKGLVAVW